MFYDYRIYQTCIYLYIYRNVYIYVDIYIYIYIYPVDTQLTIHITNYEEFRYRWNNYKKNGVKYQECGTFMQQHLFEHFSEN